MTCAVTAFAENSFDAVSLRSIAREAGVDPALVHKYFGSKDQLFGAAVLDRATQLYEVDRLAEVPLEELGAALINQIDRALLTPDGQVIVALVRRVISGTPEFARNLVENYLLPRLEELLTSSASRSRSADGYGVSPLAEAERHLRASLVFSQVGSMMIARHIIGLPALRALSTEQVAVTVGPIIQNFLAGPLPTQSAS